MTINIHSYILEQVRISSRKEKDYFKIIFELYTSVAFIELPYAQLR